MKLANKPNEKNKKRSPHVRSDQPTRSDRKTLTLTPLSIVGIGASAGGLEAIRALLEALPLKTGLAYVLVQHLDPDHKSMLVEILARSTAIPVTQVKNRMVIEPDHIYVIPPDKCMTLKGGVLMLSPRLKEKKSINLPIDDFFLSLVKEMQEKSIGIILSGTASDGTVGLRAIKEAGGLTFAQDSTAKYQSMPQSAISASVVDYVLPPEKIAKELVALTKHTLISKRDSKWSKTKMNEQEDYRRIIVELLRATGVDFSNYKETTVTRRIDRRILLNKTATPGDYLNYLRGNGTEAEALFNDILIHVTDFFRDPSALKVLTQKILTQLVKVKSGKNPLRIWVAGCATGEEVYSLAICLFEFMESKSLSIPLQIFGTDLAEVAISKARRGIYTSGDINGISPQRLERYFIKTNGAYQIRKDIRDMCVFSVHNLLKDSPFSRIDIVSCCNVLIYMDTTLQHRVLSAFHYSLIPEGVLILGKSESVGVTPKLFTQVAKESKVFTKKIGSIKKLPPITPSADLTVRPRRTVATKEATSFASKVDVQDEADAILVGRFAPASVLVGADYEILQFRGDTSEYLKLPTGKATLNLLKIAREGLVSELRGAILKAKRTGVSAQKEVLQMVETETHAVLIEVIPLKKASAEPHFLVIFHAVQDGADVAGSVLGKTPASLRPLKTESSRNIELRKEIALARDNERALAEEQEAAVEELQSANEEILSSNEELQSINEELETSSEELESTNEELSTINQELQTRNEQLTESRAYTEAIVETARESLLVLTGNLRVKSANESFFKTFKVSKEKTEGNYLYELGNGQWDVPQLRRLLNEILPKNTSVENFEIEHTFPIIGHKVLVLNARKLIQDEGKTELILLAIEDMTESVLSRISLEEQEARLQQTIAHLKLATNSAHIGIWSLNVKTQKLDWSALHKRLWGYDEERQDLVYKDWYKVILPEDKEITLQKLEEAKIHKKFYEVTYRIKKFNDDSIRWIKSTGQYSFDEAGEAILLSGISTDITEQIKAEKKLKESQERLCALVKASSDVVYCMNADWGEMGQLDGGDFVDSTARPSRTWLKDTVHPDDQKRLMEVVSEAILTKGNVEIEYRVKLLNSGFGWVFSRAVPILNENGEIVEWFGAVSDINERKELDQHKEEFIGIASHEIKTPVTTIKTFTELLQKRLSGKAKEENAVILEHIFTQSDRLTVLVDDLLSYSQMQAGEFLLTKKKFDFDELMERSVDAMKEVSPHHTITLEGAIKHPIVADASRIEQVLINLLTNAIKYSPDGKIIKVRVEKRAEELAVSIQDFGIGIKKEDHKTVFQRFYRGKEKNGFAKSEKAEGFGLGLFIAAQIIDKHEGSIEVKSVPGKGSTFTFTLPLKKLAKRKTAARL